MNKHIQEYISYFRKDKNISVNYIVEFDQLVFNILINKVAITYTINNPSSFCSQMTPNDFGIFVIDQTISVFNIVNARI